MQTGNEKLIKLQKQISRTTLEWITSSLDPGGTKLSFAYFRKHMADIENLARELEMTVPSAFEALILGKEPL